MFQFEVIMILVKFRSETYFLHISPSLVLLLLLCTFLQMIKKFKIILILQTERTAPGENSTRSASCSSAILKAELLDKLLTQPHRPRYGLLWYLSVYLFGVALLKYHSSLKFFCVSLFFNVTPPLVFTSVYFTFRNWLQSYHLFIIL